MPSSWRIRPIDSRPSMETGMARRPDAATRAGALPTPPTPPPPAESRGHGSTSAPVRRPKPEGRSAARTRSTSSGVAFVEPRIVPIERATDLGSVQVLKHGNLYLLTDPFGDIRPDSRGLGLYLSD